MLLDSASLYFRAFYGVKSAMPAPDGTPTNAVRGFLDMVSTLITRFRPSDLVACVDQDWRPAWRVALVPSYKTHRLAVQEATPAGGAPPGEAEPPGLAGIGEKTAASLLRTFGTLEELLEAAARRDRRVLQVAGKLNAAHDYLSRAPAVVRTARDLSLPPVDSTLPHAPPDVERLAELGVAWGIGNALVRATKALSGS